MLLTCRKRIEDALLAMAPNRGRGVSVLIAWSLLAGAVAGICYAASNETAFEVASVKPAALLSELQETLRDGLWERNPLGLYPVNGRTLRLESIRLSQLIAMAYRVRTHQVIGPKDLTSGRFSIEARLPEGVPHNQVDEMLKNLLAERFALKVHLETRSESGLHLVRPCRRAALKGRRFRHER